MPKPALLSNDLQDKLLEYKNPVVVFLCGILVGAVFYFKSLNPLFLFIFLPFLFFKNKKIIILVFSLIIGYFYPILYENIFTVNSDHLLDKKNIYIGEILSSADESSIFNKKYFFKILEMPEKNMKIKSSVQLVASPYDDYEVGDIVQLKGVLKKPKTALLPSLFNERNYLLTKGINYLLCADRGTIVFLDESNDLIQRQTSLLRTKIIKHFEKNLTQDRSSLVSAILIGSKASKLSKGLKDKIRDLGLSHITSASGFNVGILSFGIFWLFRIFTRNIFLPSIFSIFAILLYSAIADFSSSIIRASIFIILVLTGSLFNKKLKILPGISIILLGFFLISPYSLLDIGLQLSCLSFLGIILFSLKEVKFPFSIFWQTLIAQIMIIPLVIFYFHNIQLLGLVSNLLAIPLASMILICSLVSVVFPFLNLIVMKLLSLLSFIFIEWINLLYAFPIRNLYVPNLNFSFLILVYISLFIFLLLLFVKEKRKHFFLSSVILIALFLMTHLLTDTSTYIKVFFIPRYNQEAVLVIKPDKKPLFISNRYDESFKEKILEFLRLNNIKEDLEYCKKNPNIKYGDFNLSILGDYTEKINGGICVKLPILMKSDPDLSMVFISYPEYLIVNDYKRLSKKSRQDIQYLKSIPVMSFFLSQSGSITLISNGKKHKIVTSNE